MKEFFPVLHTAALFSGISENELTSMLSCLGTRKEDFPKKAFVLRAGDTVDSIGIVLSGSVLIIQEDIWGNWNILSKAGPGQTFAAVYACAPGSRLNVSVIAETPVTVMFLNVKRILNVCPSACSHHSRVIRNLLSELAEKNFISQSHLISLFHARYGISPQEYLLSARIDRAKELLKNKDESIKSVALSVGIENSLYFSRLFKKKTGVTPTEFAKRVQNIDA